MHALRPLTLLALSAALAACPAKDDEPTDDTDTDVEDTDTDVEDTDDTDEDTDVDTDTDTDVTAQLAPCEAEDVDETRIVLDPTEADTLFFDGGAAQGGIPIPIPGPETTWIVEDTDGGAMLLESGAKHRFIVEFDPAVTLARAGSYAGVRLQVLSPPPTGDHTQNALMPTVVREGTLTHDEVTATEFTDGRFSAVWSESPNVTGGSSAVGDTLTCVALEFTANNTGTFEFKDVELRLTEAGDTRGEANPFQPASSM